MKNDAILKAAMAAHDVNRAYCQSLGDDSQPTWDNAPAWQKESAKNGVLHVINNPDATPDFSHNSWLKEKEDDGWKYGPVKDPQKKEHPCFVPFENLPVSQKMKDTIFVSVVKGVLSDR